jgi:hypothetical protein
MSVFEHERRSRIYNQMQHPYRHNLSEFVFAHSSMPGVSTVEGALAWIIAVLYPNTKAAVATTAALPAAGNSINDYRVVQDDGDGKAASYRWEQREGDVAPKWWKVYDMDWGEASILSSFMTKTQDVYVFRHGFDDRDSDGVVVAGTLAGQRIYGGATAGTHLSLFANAGDGVGAQTGYVQVGDNFRPTQDSAFSSGTNTERWLKVWTDELTSGTMTLTGGSIADSSGAISFNGVDLTNVADLTAEMLYSEGLSMTVGGDSLVMGPTQLVASTGLFSFVTTSVATDGTVDVDGLLLAAGSITDATGSIDFGNENLSTTGTFAAGAITGSSLAIDNVSVNGNAVTVTDVNGNLSISANGSGSVAFGSPITTGSITTTGDIEVTGDLGVVGAATVDLLGFDGQTISTISGNSNLILDPHGTGLLEAGAGFFPTTDSAWDLGKTGNVWNKLWIDGSIGGAAQEITLATLLSLRDINSGVGAGYSIFWDGSKWVSSLPDSEVDHGSVSGLSDDDHSQYALLAGRGAGQALNGGVNASGTLELDSTAHGTKGHIIHKSTFRPGTDNAFDLGTSSQRVRDLYLAGQAIGLRLQNSATASRPSASASNIGRLYYDTDVQDVYVDLGGTWKKVSVEKYETEDASGWTGAVTSKTYTVSGDVSDARKCIWAFYANGSSFEQLGVTITKTATQVTVTAAAALPAGTYTLVGIG